MTLLRYLGVGEKAGAGVGAEAGAGAGAGAGADKNTCMNADLALFVVFGFRHVTCGFMKKRRNYFNCSPKQNWPSLSGSHWWTNLHTRETEAYTGSCALLWYDFSTKLFSISFCYIWHTQNFLFHGGSCTWYFLTFSKSWLLQFSYKSFISFCCSLTFTLRWLFTSMVFS